MLPADQPVDEAVSEEAITSDESQESNEETEVSDSSEETSDEASDEGTSTDKWLVPGRFRTADDVVKSYTNLESEFHRRNQELASLKAERSRPVVDRKTANEQFAEAVKRDPEAAIRNIVKSETDEAKLMIRKEKFDSEYHTLMKNNEEFRELEPLMAQVATQYGDLLDENAKTDPRLFKVLFDAAKGLKADELARKAEETGKAKGQRNALKKQKAQVEGSSGTKGHSTRKFEELSLAEMEKELKRSRA